MSQKFHNIANFPGVIAAVDGTHVPFLAPSHEEWAFVNRKGTHSVNIQVWIFTLIPVQINVLHLFWDTQTVTGELIAIYVQQIVSDANLIIRDVVAKWPGSTHDSFMLSQSNLAQRFENGDFGGHILLGDSGYPCKPWLMTPFISPSTAGQRRYNYAHKATRSTVERCIGVLKSRFRYVEPVSKIWHNISLDKPLFYHRLKKF